MTGQTASQSPLRRAWRATPHAFRQNVNVGMTHMAQRVGQVRGQLERGGAASRGVCVMGLHRAILGIGRGARLFQAALSDMGLPTSAWDVTSLFGHDLTLDAPASDFSDMTTVVSHLNPIEHLRALALHGDARPKRGFRAGYWAWETSRVPDDWIKGIAAVDEIWCPSHFTAQSISHLVGNRRPVRVVPFLIPPVAQRAPDKAKFGLAPDKVCFFAACDLRSSLERKNPFGAIEAFARSGCGVRGEAQLLIKTHGDFEGSGLKALLEAAQKTPGVIILDAKLSSADMEALQGSIDVMFSPHRSEGFGLVLAEAMQAGIPVIATNWSGNMDFMDTNSAALISSKEVSVLDSSGIYNTGTWAEPDLDHAASLIADLAGDSDARARLGQAGLAHIREFSDLARWQSQVGGYLRL